MATAPTPPAAAPAPPTRRNAKIVSVINMKGGVGKTLISANVFREVYRRKRKRVLLIDFDPQYNLSQLLLMQTAYVALQQSNRTLISVMEPPPVSSVFQTSTEDLLEVGDVSSYVHRLNYFVHTPEIELNLIAGDFELAKINVRENALALRFPRIRLQNFIQKARTEYDLIVLDCNPSTSFLTRAALEVSTHLVVPIRPDRYSVLGAEMLLEFMNFLPTLNSPPEQILVLNGIKGNLSEPERNIVNQLRGNATLGPLTLVNMVPLSDVLKARPDYSGFAVDRGVPYGVEIKYRLGLVADEISQKLGFR